MDSKISYQSELFGNRLSKNYRQLKKWARKNDVSCYRLYDKDIPEIPLACDLYIFLPDEINTKSDALEYSNKLKTAVSQNLPEASDLLKSEKQTTWLHLYLYDRPYEKDEEEESQWLFAMKKKASQVLEIPEEQIILKHRKKQTDGDKREQYTKLNSEKTVKGIVQEKGNLFYINLSNYLDTGLFFDHRPLRKTAGETSLKKSVLNLFCYTGSFSVYCAEGGAESVTSVDLSNTYLEWAKQNMELNGFTGNRYSYIASDVFLFLEQAASKKEKYDLIVLDPPTFSNSKKTKNVLDINRDWSTLVKLCTEILSEKGVLYFSTNSRKIEFEENLLPEGFSALDISDKTIPEDYRNKKIHQAWKIFRSQE